MNNLFGPSGNSMSRKEEKEMASMNLDAPTIVDKDEPKPLSWEELEKLSIPPPSWLIDKWLPTMGIVVFAAMSGTGKSWILLEMAKAIISGADFLGKFKTKVSNVLYIDAEGYAGEMQRRGRQLGLKKGEGTLFVLNKVINLNDYMEEEMDWLVGFVKENEIQVVFLDTFRGVAGGLKEEKAEEVRTFFNRFKINFAEKEIVFVFAEHLRKRGMFEPKTPQQEQVFSSMDKVAAADVLLLAKHEQIDADNDEIHVYQGKNKFSLKEKPFRISMRDELDEAGAVKTILEYAGDVGEPEAKVEEARKIILEILPEGGKTTKEIIAITNKKVGEKNTRNALKALAGEGAIKERRQGKEKFYWVGEYDGRSETPTHTQEDELFDSS